MLCNAVGAGLLAVLITMYPDAKSNPRLLWGTGALGAFTSYSALASLAAVSKPVLPNYALAWRLSPRLVRW